MGTHTLTKIGPNRNPDLIFAATAGAFDAAVRDAVSGTDWTQTYAGENRTRINSAGLLELVPANTPVIDHIGASLEPVLRVEGEGTNLLFGSNAFDAAGGYTLSNVTTAQNAVGPSGAANEAWTVTDADGANLGYFLKAITKSVSDSTTYFLQSLFVKKTSGAVTFPGFGVQFSGVASRYAQFAVNTNTGVLTQRDLTAAANVGSRIESAGDFWKVSAWSQDNGANSSVLFVFVPAANTDAGATWAAATQGSCVIANGKLTTGSIPSSYFAGAAAIGAEVIAAQADRDFSGASNWTNVDINAYDETTDLTITANAAGQYCQLPEAAAPMTVGKVYRIQFTIANYVGGWTVGDFDGNVIGTVGANDTYYFYWVCTATGGGLRLTSTAINSSGDFDNFSIKEHGTVRASEANTLKLAVPAAVSTALAATGTIVMDWMPAYARAAGVVTGILASADATASLLYTTTTAGNLSSNDGTAVAASTAAYLANTWTKLALKFPSDTDLYKIGADVDGAGVVWGTEAAFDGAFTVGDNLIFGYALHGTMYMRRLRIFNKLITDAQVNAL